MLVKINKITNWQAGLIILIIGSAVFFTGLSNPFIGDDNPQIVNNIPVHSIKNVKQFFQGSTFYNGQDNAPLAGVYYRPLMTTVFSLLYSAFGPNPTAFHILQLLLFIGSTFLLFLIYKYYFSAVLSLFLALIFLVHPLNSQVAFAMPSMQDALFFFFGILGLWLLMKFQSTRVLLIVAGCLLLSLLAKETGFLFLIMYLIYLLRNDKRRLYLFISIITLPLIIYLVLKTQAVGLLGHTPNSAPIDKSSLGGRLITLPSILLFYFFKTVAPFNLASSYYWVHPVMSFGNFFIPLTTDLLVIGLFIYLGLRMRNKKQVKQLSAYLFFTTWTVIGLLPHLQLVPLDFTASGTWIYFSMAGLMGMIGAVLSSSKYMNRSVAISVGIFMILILGLLSAERGTSWRSSYSLANNDIQNSENNYTAYDNLAIYFFDKGDFFKAKNYASESVSIYPTAENEATLGGILGALGDFPQAQTTLMDGLRHQDYYVLYENLGILTLYYGNKEDNRILLLDGLKQFPNDSTLWQYLAIWEKRYGDKNLAHYDIKQAAKYGMVPHGVYDSIINDKNLILKINEDKFIQIP